MSKVMTRLSGIRWIFGAALGVCMLLGSRTIAAAGNGKQRSRRARNFPRDHERIRRAGYTCGGCRCRAEESRVPQYWSGHNGRTRGYLRGGRR